MRSFLFSLLTILAHCSPSYAATPAPKPTPTPIPSVFPPVTLKLDDDQFTFTGNWVKDKDPADLNGFYHYNCNPGESAAVQFTGSGFSLYFPVSPHLGTLEVILKNSQNTLLTDVVLNQLSATLKDQTLQYSLPLLPQDTYSLTLKTKSICTAIDRIDLYGKASIIVAPTPTPSPTPTPTPTPTPSPTPTPTPVPSTWTMNFGINDLGHNYWDPVAFNDSARSCTGFWAWDSTGSGKTPPPLILDADHYPQSDAQCLTYMTDTPAGDYTLTWEGTAKVMIPWAKKTVSTGTNSAIVTLAADNQIYIQVTGFNAAAPFKNLHLWMPGTGPSSPMWRAEYTKNLKDIGLDSVRTIASLNMWDNTQKEWIDRTPGIAPGWANDGIPYEAVIALAIEANLKRIWISVPAMASDDYIKQTALLFHSKQELFGKQILVEWTNESWNFGHTSYNWSNSEGNNAQHSTPQNIVPTDHQSYKGVLYYDGNISADGNNVLPHQVDAQGNPIYVTDSYTRDGRASATRAYEMAKIFQSVYADRPNDLGLLYAGQAGWNAWGTIGFQWFKAKFHDNPFKYYAIAPYYDPLWNGGQYCPTGGCKTTADLMAAAKTNIEKDVPNWIDQNLPVAKQYGVKLIDYEGGQNFYPINGDPCTMTDPSSVAQRDPSFKALNLEYFKILQDHGVDTHFEFGYISDWSKNDGCKFGYWAALLNPTDTVNNPRWDALKEANAHAMPGGIIGKIINAVKSIF